MKTKSILLSVLSLIAISASLLTGCGTQKLDPAGAYQGDAFLAGTDQTIKAQHDGLSTFLKWEQANRQEVFQRWPAVTRTADNVRSNAPTWFFWVGIGRADYIATRQLSGGLTNSPALDSAKSNFLFRVSTIDKRVDEAQAAVNSTAVKNKPVLK